MVAMTYYLTKVMVELPDDWLSLDDLQTVIDEIGVRTGKHVQRLVSCHTLRRAAIELFAAEQGFGSVNWQAERGIPSRTIEAYL